MFQQNNQKKGTLDKKETAATTMTTKSKLKTTGKANSKTLDSSLGSGKTLVINEFGSWDSILALHEAYDHNKHKSSGYISVDRIIFRNGCHRCLDHDTDPKGPTTFATTSLGLTGNRRRQKQRHPEISQLVLPDELPNKDDVVQSSLLLMPLRKGKFKALEFHNWDVTKTNLHWMDMIIEAAMLCADICAHCDSGSSDMDECHSIGSGSFCTNYTGIQEIRFHSSVATKATMQRIAMSRSVKIFSFYMSNVINDDEDHRPFTTFSLDPNHSSDELLEAFVENDTIEELELDCSATEFVVQLLNALGRTDGNKPQYSSEQSCGCRIKKSHKNKLQRLALSKWCMHSENSPRIASSLGSFLNQYWDTLKTIELINVSFANQPGINCLSSILLLNKDDEEQEIWRQKYHHQPEEGFPPKIQVQQSCGNEKYRTIQLRNLVLTDCRFDDMCTEYFITCFVQSSEEGLERGSLLSAITPSLPRYSYCINPFRSIQIKGIVDFQPWETHNVGNVINRILLARNKNFYTCSKCDRSRYYCCCCDCECYDGILSSKQCAKNTRSRWCHPLEEIRIGTFSTCSMMSIVDPLLSSPDNMTDGNIENTITNYNNSLISPTTSLTSTNTTRIVTATATPIANTIKSTNNTITLECLQLDVVSYQMIRTIGQLASLLPKLHFLNQLRIVIINDRIEFPTQDILKLLIRGFRKNFCLRQIAICENWTKDKNATTTNDPACIFAPTTSSIGEIGSLRRRRILENNNQDNLRELNMEFIVPICASMSRINDVRRSKLNQNAAVVELDAQTVSTIIPYTNLMSVDERDFVYDNDSDVPSDCLSKSSSSCSDVTFVKETNRIDEKSNRSTATVSSSSAYIATVEENIDVPGSIQLQTSRIASATTPKASEKYSSLTNDEEEKQSPNETSDSTDSTTCNFFKKKKRQFYQCTKKTHPVNTASNDFDTTDSVEDDVNASESFDDESSDSIESLDVGTCKHPSIYDTSIHEYVMQQILEEKQNRSIAPITSSSHSLSLSLSSSDNSVHEEKIHQSKTRERSRGGRCLIYQGGLYQLETITSLFAERNRYIQDCVKTTTQPGRTRRKISPIHMSYVFKQASDYESNHDILYQLVTTFHESIGKFAYPVS